MDFQNQGRPLSDEGMDRFCTLLGIADPEVWAVLTVETRAFGFLQDRRSLILFERHIFHRLTTGRHDAGNADISNEKSGGYTGGTGSRHRDQAACNGFSRLGQLSRDQVAGYQQSRFDLTGRSSCE